MNVKLEVQRVLDLLRNKIRDQGFNQLKVQAELGWGKSYISQLLTKQKTLRVEQVLAILDVIGVAPGDFWAELYGTGRSAAASAAPAGDGGVVEVEDVEVRNRVENLVRMLVRKGVLDEDDLGASG